MASKNPKKSGNAEQHARAGDLDALAEFEDFREKILPGIRRLLREGKSQRDIYLHYKEQLAGRKISIALDPTVSANTALAAIQDIENRIDGKPTEKKEVAHKFEQLPADQLDAMLLSELEAADGAESEPESDEDLN